MFNRLVTACCTSALLLLASAGFGSSDEQSADFHIKGERPAISATTQPGPENMNHEPGRVLGLLPRDPKAERTSIDLTRYYTLSLDEDASGAFGYTLWVLPRGLNRLGNVKYDLRGIIQVSAKPFVEDKKVFPKAVKGIQVNLKCRTLCFLHATRWTEDEGRQIGAYVVHYSDGQKREVPIRFGVDLRDWRPVHDPHAPANAPRIAWHGLDGKMDVVVFEMRWTNPRPDAEIASIDMVSAMTEAAPFLVAVTAQ